MPVKPILVANDISVYKAEVQDQGTVLPLPCASQCDSMLCVLTSLPMQRCCIPTLFSHLWWRLILQALQRRPCFAVFPARNTTCLAVVPETPRKKKEKTVHVHVRSWTSIHSGPNCNLLQQKGMEEMENIIQNCINCGTN